MEEITNSQLQSSINGLRKDMEDEFDNLGRIYATKEEVGDKYLLKQTFFTLTSILIAILVSVVSFQTWLIFRLDDQMTSVDERITNIGTDTAFIKGTLQEFELAP